MFEIIIVIAAVIWVVCQVGKDASLKQVPLGTDPVQVNSDRCSGKYTDKEINQRIYSGYYVKKDK